MADRRQRLIAYGRPAGMLAAAAFGLWASERAGLGLVQGLCFASLCMVVAMAAADAISLRSP